jgi:hypothetical protein
LETSVRRSCGEGHAEVALNVRFGFRRWPHRLPIHQRVTTLALRTIQGFAPVAGANPDPIGVVKVQAEQWKLGSATIGVSAVVAMGALGLIFGDVSSAEPEPVVGPVAPQATEQTITTTTPPPAPETSVATPSVTATTPSGFAPAPGP